MNFFNIFRKKERKTIKCCMDISKKAINYSSNINLTGKNIGIAILDTGISLVEDFCSPSNRVIAFKDFINGRKNPYDDNGHGTHVAGIASGNGTMSNKKYMGVAPKSNIISIKILDKNGQGTPISAIKAMEWILKNRHKYNIRVVNLSIGTQDKSLYVPLMNAVNSLWKSGIVVVAASGNNIDRSFKITIPGINPNIITVGSYEDFCIKKKFGTQSFIYYERNFLSALKPFSKPDILAPGENIVSVMAPDFDFSQKGREDFVPINKNYIAMTGSSMATPIVSGAVALLLEKEKNITPQMVKEKLIKTSFKGNSILNKGILDLESFLK